MRSRIAATVRVNLLRMRPQSCDRRDKSRGCLVCEVSRDFSRQKPFRNQTAATRATVLPAQRPTCTASYGAHSSVGGLASLAGQFASQLRVEWPRRALCRPSPVFKQAASKRAAVGLASRLVCVCLWSLSKLASQAAGRQAD